jgi:LacI family transcriptional regulator
MPLADRLSPSLTTVRVQHYKAGLEAAGVMVDLVENEVSGAHHLVLPVELIVRNSTARFGERAGSKPVDVTGEQV